MCARSAVSERLARCVVAFAAFGTFVVREATPAAGARPGVCEVIRKSDILHVLGWRIDHVRKRPYRFGSTSGRMCNFESAQGIVTTIVPDPGSPFPGISADNTPDSADMVATIPGLGALVQIFNGAIFVTRGRSRAAVRVVPESHPASYAEIEPFAHVIVARFR